MTRSQGATVRTCKKVLNSLDTEEFVHQSTLHKRTGANYRNLHVAIEFLKDLGHLETISAGKNALLVRRIGGTDDE